MRASSLTQYSKWSGLINITLEKSIPPPLMVLIPLSCFKELLNGTKAKNSSVLIE